MSISLSLCVSHQTGRDATGCRVTSRGTCYCQSNGLLIDGTHVVISGEFDPGWILRSRKVPSNPCHTRTFASHNPHCEIGTVKYPLISFCDKIHCSHRHGNCIRLPQRPISNGFKPFTKSNKEIIRGNETLWSWIFIWHASYTQMYTNDILAKKQIKESLSPFWLFVPFVCRLWQITVSTSYSDK